MKENGRGTKSKRKRGRIESVLSSDREWDRG